MQSFVRGISNAKKIVIALAPTSGKPGLPNNPIRAEAIAADVINCARAGASVVHLHARDEAGRLSRWPSRQKAQRAAIAYLAGKFAPGREYTENEVNFLLMDWHSFGDWALLRRALYDWKFLDRESDGTRYRLRPAPPAAEGTGAPARTS